MPSILTSQRRPEGQTRKVHLNIPQLLWWLIKPKLAVLIWGRATGKTDGPTAMFLAECMDNMPRSVGRLAAYTYEGLMSNILPGIKVGWEERYGYIEGLHYWVGKRPPEHLLIPKPYREPMGDPKHNIYWWNGSVLMLSSMTGTINNGTEYDFLAIEEGRYNKKEKVDELALAKRGNKKRFKKNPYHQSVLIVSDRPKNQMGRWLIDYKEENTPAMIKLIMQYWRRISELEKDLQDFLDKEQKAAAVKIQTKINKFSEGLRILRNNTTLYSEASTLDNIHALGIDTIEGFIKLLDEWDYNISVLNKDINKAINGFYALHGPKHIHEASNHELWQEDSDKPNCLADLDCDLNQPLHIAFDVNAAINNVVTGQPKGDTIYCTNHQFVLAPKYLADLCEKWCEYYEPHHTKVVYFHYDHTLLGTDSQGKTPDYEVVLQILRKNGFNVVANYIGQAPSHDILYGEWAKVFAGHRGYRKWSSNAANCHYLRISMDNADIKYFNGKIKKDKSSERKDYEKQTFKVPPEHATHASEAADTLMLALKEGDYASSTSSGDPYSA